MPQPIDPNTELMRVTAVERIQQIMDRASLAGQAHQRALAEEEQVAMETYVQHLNQKGKEVDDERRRRTPYLGKRKHKSQKDGRDDLSDEAHVFYTASEGKEIAEDPNDHELDIEI